MNNRLVLFVIAIWIVGVYSKGSGAEFRSGDRAIVESTEVIDDDLYIFGEEVTIDGVVKGDVVAFGRVIRLNGTVEGDLIGAGQAIVISGNVGDDARLAGQVLKLEKASTIGDDLIGAAFSLELIASSAVGADLVYAGYQALINGGVGKDIKGGLANCEIAGQIGGDVELNVDGDEAGARAYTSGSPPPVSIPNVPAGLTIREAAQIDGELKYTSANDANIEEGATIAGEIERNQPVVDKRQPPAQTEKMLQIVTKYVSLLIIGFCLLIVAPTWVRKMSETIGERPLASVGFGTGGMIGFFVLLIVLLVGVILLAVIAGFANLSDLAGVIIVLGLSCGLLLAISFWFFTSYVAGIIISVFAGRWVLSLINPALGENKFLPLAVGVVALALVSNVPYLGAIVGWLTVLFGLGALLIWAFGTRFRKSSVEPAVTS